MMATVAFESLSEPVLRRQPAYRGHEQVVALRDPQIGLAGFIAIHDTSLGPALGGCRMWPYADEAAALDDVLRLSAGMTCKNALAGLDYGGGKSVIIGDPRRDKHAGLFRAFGRAVQALGGRYVAAEDVGTTPDDMDEIARQTPHVRGTHASRVADPSPYTALGVFHGILAAVEHRFGATDLTGLTCAVKGLGSVGFRVAEKLHAAGARLVAADIHRPAVERAEQAFGARAVAPEEAHRVLADIFVPCALGGDLNADSIPEMQAAIVAGSANNQLAEPADAERLHRRGILYAPDYAINAGGVIAVALGGRNRRLTEKVEAIGATLSAIFVRAAAEATTTAAVADRLANERLAAARARSAA